MKPFNEYFRQVIFFLILLALGGIIFYQLRFLFSGFLGAVTLYILNRKAYFHLIHAKHWNRYVSALMLILMDGLILLIPFLLSTYFILPRFNNFSGSANELILGMKDIAGRIYESTGIEIIPQAKLNELSSIILNALPGLIGSALNGILNIIFTFFLLFFMLSNSAKMELAILRFIPLNPDNKSRIASETRNIVTSYAIGIPALAIAQGLCAAIGYRIFGVNDPLVWGFVTAVCSVIPIVGSGIIWIPLGGFLYAQGEQGAAFGLFVYCLLVVVNVDNLLRIFLLKAFADIHPLITLLGVITGLKLFGFIGLIFGPLMVSYLLLLIRIYMDEFSASKNSA